MQWLAKPFGFFHWVGISHYLNLLFVGFLIRSGLQILSALQSSTGHFFCVVFWNLNGLVYVALLFGTNEWRRLLPTSWSIFPDAARTAWIYLHFTLPPAGNPYNPLQQLTYAGVVFVLGPILIATGAAMSPAVAARFPWYLRIFGGRQPARSIHFLALLAISLFTVGHVALVVVDDFPRNMAWIIHGQNTLERLSIAVGIGGLVIVAVLHVWATRFSLRDPARIQRLLGSATQPVQRALLHHVTSRQEYSQSEIGFFRVNGYPPESAEYEKLAGSGFSRAIAERAPAISTPVGLLN